MKKINFNKLEILKNILGISGIIASIILFVLLTLQLIR